ncbi:2Fe-2S iron-sulfur cluster-binding protein [Roseibium suaedae]|nr:2Fe-2S iron-sulfur cluster-binding protein [Roseibium suaedae]
MSSAENRLVDKVYGIMRLEDHPTVRRLRETGAEDSKASERRPLDAEELRELALACGADDVGVVEIGRAELDPQRAEILRHYPWTRSLLSIVIKMAREPVRGTPRSVSNLEFHRAGHETNEVAARIVARLQDRGVRAVNPAMGFPMEMQQNPGNAIWIVSHKPVAVAAGLGRMGIHRNLIHPKFGNFVLLGTVLLDQEIGAVDEPIDFNPCLECNLCVAVCPVGAIKPDGEFNFQACFTHNYREFMGGFNDWVEQVADSRDAIDYRKRVNEPETASMWQSLTYGANYKSAYCMAVCPAGEDVIGPYLKDKASHRREILRPLQDRPETIYVVAGTDAEDVARRKWKNKIVKPVGNGMTPRTISGLLTFMPIVFQPEQSRGLNAVYHFTFTGAENRQATITVRDRKITIRDGLIGDADLRMTADSKTWLGFLAKEKNLFWALARRKIKISGNPKLLLAFGKCFPSPEIKREHVEIVPENSLLVPAIRPFEKNDPASGKVRWYGELVLSEIEQVTHNVKTFRLVNPHGGEMPFRHVAGQYLTLDIEPDGIATRRSYTIASPPSWRDHIEITLKREDHGLVSRWLHDTVKVGDRINVEAPSGSFVFSGSERPSVVLIGGGVGVTPMMSIARYLTDTGWPGTIYMLNSFLTPKDFIFESEIESLRTRNPRMHVATAITNPEGTSWSGATGFINARFLQANVPDIALHPALICGPTPMMDAVKATLIGLGVPAGQVRTESFGTDKRDPTQKADKSAKVVAKVSFLGTGLSAHARAGMSLLDVADEADVFIDNACRSGTCGTCLVKLKSGEVRMGTDEALSDDEKKDGYILACQAEPCGDVELEV